MLIQEKIYKMSISINEVDELAKLSKLEFSQQEKKELIEQLNNILDYVDLLNQLDTEDVEPATHVVKLSNVFHEDQVTEFKRMDQLLENAPEKDKNFFLVPKVIK